MLSEFKLITKLTSQLQQQNGSILLGIGDDCAVFEKDAQQVNLISTDALIEHVHFDLSYTSFADLGRKALAVNLSDVAAMAGEPVCAVISLAIPKHVNESALQDFYKGLNACAKEYEVAIVGGDTCKSLRDFMITVTVVGVAEKSKYKTRSAAKAGDQIYMSGVLGSSAIGLAGFQQDKAVRDVFKTAHLTPKPQLKLAQVLAELPEVHACIDLSDGLLQDLGHVLKQSNVGAKVFEGKVPVHESFTSTCESLGLDALQTKLAGGEDYQLLFTVKAGAKEMLSELVLAKGIAMPVCIGEIVSDDAGLTLLDSQEQEVKIKTQGFDHFK
jgi:thiamine-monophosphate kinase